MTARFAGSRHLDQRRRRRIAQESAPTPLERRAPIAKSEPAENADPAADADTARANADESLIPRSRWKIAAACTAGLISWAGILWLGTDSAWKESALEEVVALESGRLAKFFSTVALLGASQLSTLILWYRSQSRKDFAGRYRIWAWASVYWSLMCIGAATGFHRPLAALLYEYWRIECWRPQTVYWLGPAAAGFVALYTLLGRELRQSPASRWLWNSCAACGIAVSLLALGLDVSIAEPARLCVEVGAVTLWHYLAAATFLVHARFVVHVNREAAPKLKPMPNRLVLWYLNLVRRLLAIRAPRLSFRLKSSASDAGDGNRPATKGARPATQAAGAPSAAGDRTDAASEETEAASTTRRPSPRTAGQGQTLVSSQPNRKLRIDPPQAPAPAPRTAGRAASSKTESATAAGQESPSSVEDALHDDLDDIDFGQLSRKERRKLRKLRRSERR